MRFIRAFVFFPALLIGAYYFWGKADRQAIPVKLDLNIQEIKGVGGNSGKGNVVGIQPYMFPDDYSSEAHFYIKMDAYLNEAKENNLLNPKTVVLFPEHIGTWLVACGEKQTVFKTKTMDDAMTHVVLSNLYEFLQVNTPDNIVDETAYSIFTMKSSEMARIYHYVFSSLAQKYKVTIIAGSILLSEPYVVEGVIKSNEGQLYNTSVVYNPDGKAQQQVVKKVKPILAEQCFTMGGNSAEIPVFELPIGKTGILVCADSWYPENYRNFANQSLDFIAVPSFLTSDEALSSVWQGYNGSANPSDVDPNDFNQISEEEAWLKYALPGRIQSTGVSNGLNVFLRGKLWDMGSDGYTFIIKDGQLVKGKKAEGASIISLWL